MQHNETINIIIISYIYSSEEKVDLNGLPSPDVINDSYVMTTDKHWIDRRYVTCTGTEYNLSDCNLEPTLMYMYGCDRETLYVDCLGEY